MAKFFSFDGIDGVGKSTQLGQFSRWLGDSGHDVIVCRDPGGTKLGEVIREILLDHGDVTIGARSEMLLYMASRAQLVDEVIRPALVRGEDGCFRPVLAGQCRLPRLRRRACR